MDKTKYIIVKITDDELASLTDDELNTLMNNNYDDSEGDAKSYWSERIATANNVDELYSIIRGIEDDDNLFFVKELVDEAKAQIRRLGMIMS